MWIKSKLMLFCFSILIFTTASTTYAEYYLVYPGPYIECGSPCCGPCHHPCRHYLRFISRHRHNYSSEYQMAEYDWVGDP